MNRPSQTKKYHPNLVLTSVLSGGLTITCSLVYILLSLVYFLFRTNCSAALTPNGAEYFWTTVFRVYVQSESSCEPSRLSIERLMHESTVLVFVSLVMSFSILSLLSAVSLIMIIQDEKKMRYITYVVYTYIGICVASLIIDLVMASHFGVDYSYITSLLGILTGGSSSNYRLEVIRQGAFWLMTIALKGFVFHIVNAIFLVLLVVYVLEQQKMSNTSEHSILKLGPVIGYDQPRNPEVNNQDPNWSNTSDAYNNLFLRSPQGSSNNGYVEDLPSPRSPMRPDRLRADHGSPLGLGNSSYDVIHSWRTKNMDINSFDRSDSWHHSLNNASPNARPFSYLEEVKRPPPLKLQAPPVIEPSWRQDPRSPGPPVPAPDYSPTQPRRLKPALKPYL